MSVPNFKPKSGISGSGNHNYASLKIKNTVPTVNFKKRNGFGKFNPAGDVFPNKRTKFGTFHGIYPSNSQESHVGINALGPINVRYTVSYKCNEMGTIQRGTLVVLSKIKTTSKSGLNRLAPECCMWWPDCGVTSPNLEDVLGVFILDADFKHEGGVNVWKTGPATISIGGFMTMRMPVYGQGMHSIYPDRMMADERVYVGLYLTANNELGVYVGCTPYIDAFYTRMLGRVYNPVYSSDVPFRVYSHGLNIPE